jgi:hypothetical protein
VVWPPADTAQRLIQVALEIAQGRQIDGNGGEVHLLAGAITLHIRDQ